MRLAITSDLHLDPDDNLTPRAEVESLCGAIERARPDAVILAGDLGVDLAAFESCVGVFRRLGLPCGVLAGNHDLWRDERAGLSSEALWGGALREASARAGASWLEGESLRLGGVAVVGTIGWYDYSAKDAGVEASLEQIALAKHQLNNDAYRIDWEERPGLRGRGGRGVPWEARRGLGRSVGARRGGGDACAGVRGADGAQARRRAVGLQ